MAENGKKIEGDFEELVTKIPDLLKKCKCPGANIGIISGGSLVSEKSFGYANTQDKIPLGPHHHFQLASISKSITSWGIMKLVEQGKLDLDAPIEEYLTRWHLSKNYEISILKKYCPGITNAEHVINHNDVTVRRLLSHTAGLRLSGYDGFDLKIQKLPSIEESLSGKTQGLEGDVRVIFPPGDKFSYSGGGYTLLQLLVEEVTGQKFADFMEEEILIPLGMKDSSFLWRSDIQLSTASAYNAIGELLPNFQFTALAAAGCYSTVKDLATFVMASMIGPKGEKPGRGILKPETLSLMHSKVIAIENDGNKEISIGLGHFLTDLDGLHVVHHAGGNQGWKNLMSMTPSRSTGLIVLTNGDGGESIILTLMSKWNEMQFMKK